VPKQSAVTFGAAKRRRIATFAEALSSCSWAGGGALAAASTWLVAIPGLIALSVVDGGWLVSPAKKTFTWRRGNSGNTQTEWRGQIDIRRIRHC
jgi:hypothetical protein